MGFNCKDLLRVTVSEAFPLAVIPSFCCVVRDKRKKGGSYRPEKNSRVANSDTAAGDKRDSVFLNPCFILLGDLKLDGRARERSNFLGVRGKYRCYTLHQLLLGLDLRQNVVVSPNLYATGNAAK